jgi:hypothetical protein
MSINHFLFTKNAVKHNIGFHLLELYKLKFVIFILVAKAIPKKLRIKGNHFIPVGKNSASKYTEFTGKVKIALSQKLVPGPIKKSFVKKPTNKLPTANVSKGKYIKNDDSCTLLSKILWVFELLTNVK